MNKDILILTGSPSGKVRFDEIAKRDTWIWNINPRNPLTKSAKDFKWNGIKDKNYYDFISECFGLVNSHFGFEEKYILEKLETFTQDEDEVKVKKGENGQPDKTLNNFALVFHGVTPDVKEMLQGNYGAFEIHFATERKNTDAEGLHDIVIYDDDPNFESEVLRVLNSSRCLNN